MKTKETIILYYTFLAGLLVFFFRTAAFWYSSINIGESTHDILLYASLCLVDLILIVYVLLNHINKRAWRGGVHWVCLCWLLLMLVSIVFSGVTVQIAVKMILWPLLFEGTYLFVREDNRRYLTLSRFYYAVMAIGLVFFIGSTVFQSLGFQTNTIYFVTLTAPFLLLTNNKKRIVIILAFMSLASILSLKRSMMLAFLLFFAVWFIVRLFRTGKILEMILVLILFAGLGFVMFRVVDNSSGGYLSSRFEGQDDVSNGRDRIYGVTWLMFLDSTPTQFVLGHGHNTVQRDSPLEVSAHNEFLEILYDYGLLALILYFFLWAYVIKRWFYHLRCKTFFFVSYTLSICLFFVMAMVSQLVVYVSYFLYLVMFWATVEALTEKDYQRYRQERKRMKTVRYPARRRVLVEAGA